MCLCRVKFFSPAAALLGFSTTVRGRLQGGCSPVQRFLHCELDTHNPSASFATWPTPSAEDGDSLTIFLAGSCSGESQSLRTTAPGRHSDLGTRTSALDQLARGKCDAPFASCGKCTGLVSLSRQCPGNFSTYRWRLFSSPC